VGNGKKAGKADPESVTRMPLAGSTERGVQQESPSNSAAHGSTIGALLRKRRGPTGIVQMCGQTTFQVASASKDNPAADRVTNTTGATVGSSGGVAGGGEVGALTTGLGLGTGEHAATSNAAARPPSLFIRAG
jgi:hypothetical protein